MTMTMTMTMTTTAGASNSAALAFDDRAAPSSMPYSTLNSTLSDNNAFDKHHGVEQNRAIFIDGNNIGQRLSKHKKTDNAAFTLAETGFGNGLNFLLTLQLYQKAQQTPLSSGHNMPPLHFISVEKHPLTRAQLKQSLASLAEFADDVLAESLLAQYPDNFNQACQLSFFDGQVSLELIFDDAVIAYGNKRAPKTGLVDAWYLDGFASGKKPEMWRIALFKEIARLSKTQATLSSLTSTEQVRQDLSEVGFRLQKINPDSHQQQQVFGIFQQSKTSGKGYQLRPVIDKPQQVSIIGGGIASACAAYVLTQNGVNVTLYCKDNDLAQGASSNAVGALFPLLHQQEDDISLFYQQAFWRARQLYQAVNAQGCHFSHDWCGLLEISYKPALQKRQQVFADNPVWPHALIHGVGQARASEIAGLPLNHGGLFMPNAGWISPPELVTQLFNAAKKTKRLSIETQFKVDKISQQPDKTWLLHSDSHTKPSEILIVCGGADTLKLNIVNQLPLTSVRGQVSNMKTNDKISKLATVICHKGYLTPKHQQQHCIGATFDKNSFDLECKPQDDSYNLNMLDTCLPELKPWQLTDVASSKARLRCMTPDHLPMVGAMPDIDSHKQVYAHLRKDKNWPFNQPAPVFDNLYVMTGLGARGLCSAPLLADILSADICNTPYPVDNQTLFNLSPNRFVIRDLIRRKV